MSRFARKEFPAPYAVTCSICGERIAARERVSHVSMSGKWEHPACLEGGGPASTREHDDDEIDNEIEIDDAG